MANRLAIRIPALEVDDMVDLILSQVTELSDLARCVRVSKQWHLCGIKYLWRGQSTDTLFSVPMKVLSKLASNPSRFRHYASKIRHLIFTPMSNFEDEDEDPGQFKIIYDRVLEPSLWSSPSIISLSLYFCGPGWHDRSITQFEPPLPLLQPQLQKLSIFGCSPKFMAPFKAIRLKWLSIELYTTMWDDRTLGEFIQTQRDLTGLVLHFHGTRNVEYSTSLATVANLRSLRHFDTNMKNRHAAVTWDASNHGFSSLESLRISYGSLSSQVFAQIQDLTRLRCLYLWAGITEEIDFENPPELSDTLRKLSLLSTLEQVTIHNYLAEDDANDLDGAVRAFARASPLLQVLDIDCDSHMDELSPDILSEDSLIYLIKHCHRLEYLHYSRKISGDAVKIISAAAAGAPQLQQLKLTRMPLNLRSLKELPMANGTPRLQWLQFGIVTLGEEGPLTPAEADALLKHLVERLPHFKFLLDFAAPTPPEAGQVLREWNSLRQDTPFLADSPRIDYQLRDAIIM